MNQIPDRFRLENCIGDVDYYLILISQLEFRYFLCLQINRSDLPGQAVLLHAAEEKFGLTKELIDEWITNLLPYENSIRSDCIIDDIGLEMIASLAANEDARRSAGTVVLFEKLIGVELNKQIHYSNERDMLKHLFGVVMTSVAVLD